MNKIMRGKGAVLSVSLFLIVIFLFTHTQAFGAMAPDVTRLLTLSDQKFPGRVASDRTGSIYIADSSANVIRIYSHKGSYKNLIRLPYTPQSGFRPTALAVSPDNLLYVGIGKTQASDNGYIEVYTLEGASVRTINVVNPSAIAFLGTGEMYMVDGYEVKKYDAGINQVLMSFGGMGLFPNTPPKALVVNEQRGELYVLDNGAQATVGGYAGTWVWRVQVFDLAGNFLRSFSNYGNDLEGAVDSASNIALDKLGRIYVADNNQSIIVVYDEFGAYLKTIYDTAQPLVSPTNLYSSNDRIYAASNLGSYVAVFGIDTYANISVSPSSLAISYQQGMPAPSRTVAISNTGGGALDWQAATDALWLTLSANSGQVAGNANQDITATIDTAGFTVGERYSANINILSNGGSETVMVDIMVYDQAVLSVTPLVVPVTKNPNETVTTSLNIDILNNLSSLEWQAVSDSTWLSMYPLIGVSQMTTLTIDNSLPPGAYTGHITVTADGAGGSPAIVTVNLQVVAAGSLTVDTNNPGATFTITGPSGTYNGSGTFYTESNIPEGTYTIAFDPVQGFKTPPAVSQTLTSGGAVHFTGNYIDLRRQVNIIASRGPARSESSDIAVFRVDGTQALSTFVPFSTAYGSNTAIGDLDGDGIQDIVAGSGGGVRATATIKGFTRDGQPLPGLDYEVDTKTSYGVSVATGDFDGDGKDEIAAGFYKASITASNIIKVFSYSNGTVVDTGINLGEYQDTGVGVNVATADLDGDGMAELIISPKSSNTVPDVRIYKINTTGGPGNWSAALLRSFNACAAISATNIATGDIDADGTAEIISVCAGETGAEVRKFNSSGTLLGAFGTGSTDIDYIAAGDTNMDGTAEIILGDGPVKGARGDQPGTNTRSVKILDANGLLLNSFEAFSESFGVKVSVGNLGY